METLMAVISFLGWAGLGLVVAAVILMAYFLYAVEKWVNHDED